MSLTLSQSSLSLDFRAQLVERMQRVQHAIEQLGPRPELLNLVSEVESALERMKNGSFGLCEVCRENIEADRLVNDPLLRFCLEHLTANEQREFERDMELAGRIQAALLPQRGITLEEWEIDFRFQPAGVVGGDYCDLIPTDDPPGVMFLVGDVAGKGVSASMLATHLHGLFHSLARFELSIEQFMEHANRMFCESTLASQFATLICGRTFADGHLELANAGHFPALLVQENRITEIPASTVPLGLFCSLQMNTVRLDMQHGDSLLLYTDGVIEAMRDNVEYGIPRLSGIAATCRNARVGEFLNTCIKDVHAFARTATLQDDLTLMCIRRH
jgi:sigma-B regulation protein RsbU (phosphoserine phosphatase)